MAEHRVFLQPKELDLLISSYTDFLPGFINKAANFRLAYLEGFAHSQTLQKVTLLTEEFQMLIDLLTAKIEDVDTMSEVNELVGRCNYFALFLRG